MINKNRMSAKVLEEYLMFEKKYPKRLANCIFLYILASIPAIVISAIATKNMITLGIEKKYFKNESR